MKEDKPSSQTQAQPQPQPQSQEQDAQVIAGVITSDSNEC